MPVVAVGRRERELWRPATEGSAEASNVDIHFNRVFGYYMIALGE